MFGVIPRFRFNISGLKLFKPFVDDAANVSGWMSYSELKWLAKTAHRHHTIIEIGCYQGRSTCAMAQNTAGVIYAVDDFKGVRDKQIPPLPVLELFYGNLAFHIQNKQVIPVVADHANIPELPRPDMVFIDGSHEYQDVKRDIEYWKPRVLPGGLICGHDIQFDQVKKAVGETVDNYRIAPKTTIWFAFL